jgi:hypothetical protein
VIPQSREEELRSSSRPSPRPAMPPRANG